MEANIAWQRDVVFSARADSGHGSASIMQQRAGVAMSHGFELE